MGRFHWIQGHTKQNGDKLHSIAHDWLSKDSVEPSRQALTEVMKEHSGVGASPNDGFPRYQGRSRTNTVTSAGSQYTRSISDGSNHEYTSRPSSRQSYTEGNLPLSDRYENNAKGFLSRSTRILKRQGSKLNLLSSPVEDTSPERGGKRVGEVSPVKSLQRQFTNGSKRTGMKRSISGPFAFQHLSHGEQAHFQNIDTVAKSHLTSEYQAIQAGQLPEDHVRGIPITELPTTKVDRSVQPGFDEPTSPTTAAIPYLPTTPPRPEPPPKENLLLPYSPSDVRMSRSMENFSRPTRLSVTSADVSPSSQLSQRMSALSPISRQSVLGKPLPILPDVVHAVSTRDDIALPLRTAPLPNPPTSRMEAVLEEDKVQLPEISTSLSCNDLTSLTRRYKRRSQSSGELQLQASYYNITSTMTNVEATLDEPVEHLSDQSSTAKLNLTTDLVQLQDWEDAIDYSWDVASDKDASDEDKSDSDATLERPQNSDIPAENYMVVEQSAIVEPSSSASTPLMMQLPRTTYRPVVQYPGEGRSPVQDEEPGSPLLGLGLGSLHPAPNGSVANAESTAIPQHCDFQNPPRIERPHILPSPFSSISKSSSQESIIFSIASSIAGTQRSSHSSTSLSDFAHLANFCESKESLRLDLQDVSNYSEHYNRDGSKETIHEDDESDQAKVKGAECDLPNTPTTSSAPRHDRGASAPSIPIPERKSSVPTGDSPKPNGRRRAGTTNSRPRRNTRVSYSLFPNTPTP
ncbi:hypothetical protein PV08_11278 [Exophiala spinifera]|uniref:CRIB domain-containing protein n=1 Tax=Exophiala spinifera TaxID=91928 RepID=A0A0D1Y5Y0_9EURO|nr:uncharacterized protein PV08_11278 [Exophiala spinifera]KIW10316.1 hypothetical protein PV08_11278 [Exophiala spinifera]